MNKNDNYSIYTSIIDKKILWEPEHRLNHIPDDILNEAIEIVGAGLIKDIKIKEEDDKSYSVIISYWFSACNTNDTQKSDTIHTIKRNTTKPIASCGDNYCMKTRCIPVVAGYIKYARDNDFLNELLKEREKYRKDNDNKDENLLFDWKPEDKDIFKRLPMYMYDLAEELINRGFVSINPYLLEDNKKIYINIQRLGNCKQSKSPKVFGNDSAGPHDIKRELRTNNDLRPGTPNGWAFNVDRPIFKTPADCSDCTAAFCPYVIAGYMLYLKLKGRENELSEAKEYSKDHPQERYYGRNDFNFTINNEQLEKLKENIITAPQDMLSFASKLLNEGDASLSLSKYKEGKYEFFKINTSRKIKDGTEPSECIEEEYDDSSDYLGVNHLWDYQDISIKSRLLRLIGGIDYCRRMGIDIDTEVNKRKKDIAELQKISKNIEGLDKLYSFITNKKTSSMFCVIQGDSGSGKKPIIEKLATTLSQNGKITTNKYKEITLQQLSEELTKHKTQSGNYDRLTTGYEYYYLKEKQLYVLYGLEEFLFEYDFLKNDTNDRTTQKAVRHLIEVLGTFAENTYVIIKSHSKNSTNEFLKLSNKINFIYKQNVITIKNKNTEELYFEYLDDLSDEVRNMISDQKQHAIDFAEFVTFNERFLPFKNDALAHYLAEYSNIEGKPVFPPNIYDKKDIAEALDEMIGMQAVKEQLAQFESYITFQKKAKAAGIDIKYNNLHMQFLGNSGTGKTSIARIISKMLYDIGVLEENKVIEVERKDLVAAYVGQTAIKTSEKIKEAMGGVLFIDEAYSLFLKEDDSFGKEAIATLVKAMEDYKDRLIIIFAGYSKEMKNFLKANSGIESRIGYSFYFKDYTASELTEIFKRSIIKQHFSIEEDALKKVTDICDYYRKRKNFGNGRFVKKLEQETIINHANNTNQSDWEIDKITINDVPDIKELTTQSSGEYEDELKLEEIIGMDIVKQQIKKFKSKIQFEQIAASMGVKIKRGNSHMLFLGNPGTGKTTVARIIAKELYEAGIILENKLTEVERKDLIAEYIGQTAVRTANVIDNAIGGVLFIDEAYSLTYSNSSKDFGHEAIATLIKAMEDHKDDLVVIFAGYEKEMRTFIESNSGIASRIGYTFTFEDYSIDELADIFKQKLEKNGLSCTDKAFESVKTVMQYFVSVPGFGNGRFAERLMNTAIELHSDRISEDKDIPDDILIISEDDIPTIKYMIDHMPDGKNMINPEKISESQNERTAIHELGHALLQKLLRPDDPIEKITISVEGNNTLGYVRYSANNILTPTKSELNTMICISMAGIAAEEVFLGEYGNGGTFDIKNASDIAKNMIMNYGMSENGFACFDLDDAGKREVNNILKKQFEKAKKIIKKNKNIMIEAKKYLLEQRTITSNEFDKFFERRV